MKLPKRKLMRLPQYDYSQPGCYFITVCTHEMKSDFGTVVEGKFIPSHIGEIILKNWLWIPEHFADIFPDVFQLMPNHIHGILGIQCDKVREQIPKRQAMVIPKAIKDFKRFSTLEIRKRIDADFRWQRSYYDHVIRNEQSLERIREYILLNPENWKLDRNRIDDNPFVL